ncbi:MAG: hypothetical protein GF353_13750 [Candidatus Lokiarchaeota archaeon]|nr:hypothetical protein [Candidatus Lokiarchaeota archaeon]
MDKEEWNHDKFISLYNNIARNAGGWMYEANCSKQELMEKYEKSGDITIQVFAENLFYYEQRH